MLVIKPVKEKFSVAWVAILRHQGHYAQALACLTRSATLHREQNEPDEEGWALYELAMLYREEGHFQQAGEHAQKALVLFQNAGDMNWGSMDADGACEKSSRGYGRYHDAQEQLNEVLTSFHKLNNEEGYAHVLYDRSTIYEALGLYTEALVIARRLCGSSPNLACVSGKHGC